MHKSYVPLCVKEGWEVEGSRVYVPSCGGKEFKLAHPYQIHLRLYRGETDPATRLYSMHRVHDMLWPDHVVTWNYWTERRFMAHCMSYNQVVMAGGAAAGKSMDAAKIALIFWLSDPRHNACIVASTTLEALESRIWGYVAKLFSMSVLPIAGTFLRSKPPKILYPGQKEKIHGMFAVAIRSGEDETTLSTIIGRHPDKGLLMILDESTDMPPSIVKALPNLEQGVDMFQLIAIGNSSSKTDLHGALATPLKGWKSVDPMRDYTWETQHKGGVCLYFNPYDSPAIHEKDAVRKAALSRFLITEAGIEEKKRQYGEGTDSYARFVLGYWQDKQMDSSALSEQFLTEHQVNKSAEWSGFYAKEVVAGLDPAFQIGIGGGCMLRLGVFGHTTSGLVSLDFRGAELFFNIELRRDADKSGELQLAEQVWEILQRYSCPIDNLAIDASGVGRALGELIRLVSKQPGQPYRVVSVRPRTELTKSKVDPHIVVLAPSEMWLKFREFVQQGQIRGIDQLTLQQLVNRKMHLKNSKLVLEPKSEYIARMTAINPKLAHSPDESDSMMLAMQAAVMRLGFRPGMMWDVKQSLSANPYMREKEAAYFAAQQGREVTANVSRPPLVANFSSSIEDTV